MRICYNLTKALFTTTFFIGLGIGALARNSSNKEALQFNRDVRPILSDHCYACHGPNGHSREAKLRLDKRESALGTNEAGAAIVPGKPELSELVFRIESDDKDELMPPARARAHNRSCRVSGGMGSSNPNIRAYRSSRAWNHPG
jgi:hypothetical protein